MIRLIEINITMDTKLRFPLGLSIATVFKVTSHDERAF
jgi:hypothetical protein